MNSCEVGTCWQPGFYSAFYDVTACEGHVQGIAHFYRLFGRKPSEAEQESDWRRAIFMATEQTLPGFERDAA